MKLKSFLFIQTKMFYPVRVLITVEAGQPFPAASPKSIQPDMRHRLSPSRLSVARVTNLLFFVNEFTYKFKKHKKPPIAKDGEPWCHLY
ncbi:hypothetical protein CJ483_00740 [Bacillus sp. PK3_68]|nr:hypothetical protein CJ483_00740 [Bacillus sp. PK3_68]